jgi:hypothetical protein
VSPSIALPPVLNVVKVVLNWQSTAARVAKNIFYLLKGSGSGSTSDPLWLSTVADSVMTSWATSNINSKVGPEWSLQSATCRDAGGTTAQGSSTHAVIPGAAPGQSLAPGVAVVISWQIAESYRGGKPRTYLVGVPGNVMTANGDSALSATYMSQLDTAATLFMTTINAAAPGSTSVSLGTVSYHAGHTVRPTPLFRSYFGVKIHGRLDSQRRRNGRETSFPVTP